MTVPPRCLGSRLPVSTNWKLATRRTTRCRGPPV